MYQAKAGGKGRVTVLDQQARAEARDKLRLVAELRDAIDRRDITLYYQPIFSTRDGVPVAVESLARWTHPERGAISPATFVPLAEESGLIAGLGLLVLEETCRQIAEWDHLLGRSAPARANVNVSALQRRCCTTTTATGTARSSSRSRRSAAAAPRSPVATASTASG